MNRSGDPALDDPFFRVVRERHPDVDLVLLPPPASPPAVQDPQDEARARELLALLLRTATDLAAAVGCTPHSSAAWVPSPVRGTRRRELRLVFRDLSPESVIPALRSVGNVLLQGGWDARPYAADPPRLRAQHDGLTCEAAAAGTTIRVAIRTVDLALTDAVAAQLAEIRR